MSEIAYLNGEFLPLTEARVPIDDRGYTFADGIYEVIVTRNGKPFLSREHFLRLEHSAAAIDLTLPLPITELDKLMLAGIARAGFTETMVYIQVTRGVAPRRHDYPEGISPQLLLTFRPRPEAHPQLLEKGIAIITVPEIRWSRCDVKSIALLPNVLMKQKAITAGCREALFVSENGVIYECTAANIFLARNGEISTPPADHHILAGITRGRIIDKAKTEGLIINEQECSLNDLLTADEVFITSSTVDLLPVVTVDGKTIGGGRPGPLSCRIREWFAAV
jgi:D-alanine transaminase